MFFFLHLNQEHEGDVMSVCGEGSYQGAATRGRTRAWIGCMMGWTEHKSPVFIQAHLYMKKDPVIKSHLLDRSFNSLFSTTIYWGKLCL